MNGPYIKTRESEVDSLVVEELFSSAKFRSWFIKKLKINRSHKFIGAWKSFLGKYGECDVAVEFIIKKKRVILLVENKIDSPAQFKQAERYQKTGEDLVKNGKHEWYATILLSPKIYLKEDVSNEGYEYKVSYEELLDFFKRQENSERMKFKRMVIQNGIERARTGYKRTTDTNTDRFYQYYEELTREVQPELEYRKPKEVASGNTWIYFKPKILPSRIKIVHKGRFGYMDLQIGDGNARQFIKRYKNKLGSKMSIHQTNKSVSVRIMVPVMPDIERIKRPHEYRDKLVKAIRAAGELLDWWLSTH